MNKSKEILITGFALFSMFFGAGNLILPPFLGVQSGENWWLVTLGFAITAVFIPILAIIAHAKLQGTLHDFAKPISPLFASIYCIIIYIICILLPAPRTASVTHEMAIQPFFNSSSLLTSSLYFGLVLIFVLNRSKITELLGKFLTPLIVIILLAIIGIGCFTGPESIVATTYLNPFSSGVLEGYQTFDAIGGAVIGGVIVISLQLKGFHSFENIKRLIIKSGLLAGFGLLVIYTGLILNGALFGGEFGADATRTIILNQLSVFTLGQTGSVFLSVLVALACFTTAVGIITGTADYFKGAFNQSQKAYQITAIIGCLFGVIVGQFNVAFIIDIAIPVLLIVYPVTIILIVLNAIPYKYTNPKLFKVVVYTTMLFSLPDVLHFIFPDTEFITATIGVIPFAKQSFGWVIPSLISYVCAFIYLKPLSGGR
jgi:LIVCS family branched-chain amino acid:cation transporter